MNELTSQSCSSFPEREQRIIDMALKLLDQRIRKKGYFMDSPEGVRTYLRLNLEHLEREVFIVMFLDNQHRLIASETLFLGTINATAVYPREVVRMALSFNAAAVVLSHNHPSGNAAPSSADHAITKKLVTALALIDVKVLDHIVVGHGEMVSFAERGWL
ncbi:JAB domain-containing protein [Dickeya dianthicola]|uniref:JAB domain-containing protein n=1 Tax=Dickeya dianthicola TaxID=204039 RepID=UPI0003D7936B|nr:DNA repair protein RadC [Dickeya dianthicola]MCI4033151.1 DNA repair protein RadC [Dickeya dianthicola]MCI4175189.1 DNA repair protein RadC [Dickeya dianthicola]MCI4179743.1 DNA repair protein RadC [Dickeya dianthicola]MCI4182401.1 DNA repair protein RadC [Dickeya dianthicola]MCI4194023.1 DNA repair protein RadC [Dickeya dianthicola]